MRASGFLLGVLFLAILGYSVPAYAPPKCEGANPPPACNKDDGGDETGGNGTPQAVAVRSDGAPPAPSSTLYAPWDADPNCVAQKNSGNSLGAAFPRHDTCATLFTTGGASLTDDIILIVDKNNRGDPTAVTIQGQDFRGADGIVHTSQMMVPESTGTDADGHFVIHVHADGVTLFKCDTHVMKKKSICDLDVGTFTVDDLVYIPDP